MYMYTVYYRSRVSKPAGLNTGPGPQNTPESPLTGSVLLRFHLHTAVFVLLLLFVEPLLSLMMMMAAFTLLGELFL